MLATYPAGRSYGSPEQAIRRLWFPFFRIAVISEDLIRMPRKVLRRIINSFRMENLGTGIWRTGLR
jgi:hypothetical protein